MSKFSKKRAALYIFRSSKRLSSEIHGKNFYGKIKSSIALASALMMSLIAQAQPKVSSTSALQSSIQTESTSMISIAKILVGVVLAIGLVVIIYKISQGSNGAKEALIGWIVAIVVYCVACLVI